MLGIKKPPKNHQDMQQETSNFASVSLILGSIGWIIIDHAMLLGSYQVRNQKLGSGEIGGSAVVFTALNLLGSAGCSTQEFNTLCTL